MKIKVDDFIIYKNERDDLAFIISYTGKQEKNSPILIYEKAKNIATLKKSDNFTLIFPKININATIALKKSTRLYIIETENNIVRDEYWVQVRI